jgi:hypothetical protein
LFHPDLRNYDLAFFINPANRITWTLWYALSAIIAPFQIHTSNVIAEVDCPLRTSIKTYSATLALQFIYFYQNNLTASLVFCEKPSLQGWEPPRPGFSRCGQTILFASYQALLSDYLSHQADFSKSEPELSAQTAELLVQQPEMAALLLLADNTPRQEAAVPQTAIYQSLSTQHKDPDRLHSFQPNRGYSQTSSSQEALLRNTYICFSFFILLLLRLTM